MLWLVIGVLAVGSFAYSSWVHKIVEVTEREFWYRSWSFILEFVGVVKMEGLEKRKPKPTEKGIEEKIGELKASRSAYQGKVTIKNRILEAIIKDPTSYSLQFMNDYEHQWDDAMDRLVAAHRVYLEHLTTEQRHADEESWATPVFSRFNETRRTFAETLRKKTQEQEPHITPNDSISQVSSRSRSSSRSSSSSVALARADAAAKKAELLARAATLRQKKQLQERAAALEKERKEEERKRKEIDDMLQHEQEQLELKIQLAAAEARLRALKDDDEEVQSQVVGDERKMSSVEEADKDNLGLQPGQHGASQANQQRGDVTSMQQQHGVTSLQQLDSPGKK